MTLIPEKAETLLNVFSPDGFGGFMHNAGTVGVYALMDAHLTALIPADNATHLLSSLQITCTVVCFVQK